MLKTPRLDYCGILSIELQEENRKELRVSWKFWHEKKRLIKSEITRAKATRTKVSSPSKKAFDSYIKHFEASLAVAEKMERSTKLALEDGHECHPRRIAGHR